MERNCKCRCWCRYVSHELADWNGGLNIECVTGPAHAVYFGTYEAVKQKLGGNVGSEHHPFAVGRFLLEIPFSGLSH